MLPHTIKELHAMQIIAQESEAQREFKKAIKAGRLSKDNQSFLYAGRYMYMGKDSTGKTLFKNKDTRQYDV